MASRDSLPIMFIATPKDKKQSMWTKRAPSIQVSGHTNTSTQFSQPTSLIENTELNKRLNITSGQVKIYNMKSFTFIPQNRWTETFFLKNVRRVADAQNHKQRWRKELHVLGGEQSHSLPILEPLLSAHWSPGSH